MSTNDIHPEEAFIQLVTEAIEYGSQHRDEISQAVFDAALAIPTNLSYYIKQHKQHADALDTYSVAPQFRAIPAYFEKLNTLSQQGHALRENSLPAIAPAQPQQEEVTQ
jgi:hypothetical protein